MALPADVARAVPASAERDWRELLRRAFTAALLELAKRDPRILLLTADLGFTVLEPFRDRFPDRFFNVGVAEQNMIGVATGLADAGFIPYTYSITPFAVLRPLEFIRNGPVFHRLPVRIVAVGQGFQYGCNGFSHFGLEDVSAMRTQPGIAVVVPADHRQAREAMLKTWNLPGPVYYRLGKDNRVTVPGLEGRFTPGRAETIGDGVEVLIVAMGAIALEAVAAMESLAARGIGCTTMIVSTLNPTPLDDLTLALARFPVVVTVEAQYINGGLGSLICETVAEHGLRCLVARCGVADIPSAEVGSQAYLEKVHGIGKDAIVEKVVGAWRRVT